ncbi:MAG: transglutaminase domain-containing protein [bacterium]
MKHLLYYVSLILGVLFFLRVASYADIIECDSIDELKAVMQDKLKNRVIQFNIHLTAELSFFEVDNVLAQVFDEIVAEDDYLRFSYQSYQHKWKGHDNGITINITMKYRTTQKQEIQISQKISALLEQIILYDMDDVEKVKHIHNWIVRNVCYDTSHSNYSTYSALFHGTAVCQGYALLMHRMLQEASIKSNIIAGYSKGLVHIWNMAYIDGEWYHVDVTYDDPIGNEKSKVIYKYFMISDAEIAKDHSWDRELYPEARISL